MKVTCDIIRDLLPLYAEDMVSDDTKAMVEEHLADCPDCAQQLDGTRQARMIPVSAVDTDTTSIERVGQAIRKRRWTAAAFAVLLALTVSLGLYLVLNKHQYIPLEQAVVEITVTEDRVEVKFTEQVLNFVAQREIWAEESEESLALGLSGSFCGIHPMLGLSWSAGSAAGSAGGSVAAGSAVAGTCVAGACVAGGSVTCVSVPA